MAFRMNQKTVTYEMCCYSHLVNGLQEAVLKPIAFCYDYSLSRSILRQKRTIEGQMLFPTRADSKYDKGVPSKKYTELHVFFASRVCRLKWQK